MLFSGGQIQKSDRFRGESIPRHPVQRARGNLRRFVQTGLSTDTEGRRSVVVATFGRLQTARERRARIN